MTTPTIVSGPPVWQLLLHCNERSWVPPWPSWAVAPRSSWTFSRSVTHGNSPTFWINGSQSHGCYTTHVVLRFSSNFFQTSQRSSEHHYSSQLVCNTSHGEYAPGPGIADTEDAAEDTERSLGVICRIFLFPICDRSLESMFYMYICIYLYEYIFV